MSDEGFTMKATKAQLRRAGVEPKLYHMSDKVNEHGGVSALCFKQPKAIDLRIASWTMRAEAVTCPKCKAKMEATGPAPDESATLPSGYGPYSTFKPQPQDFTGWTGQRLRAYSLTVEQRTGSDSIATIERVYEQTPDGAYCCVFPSCEFRRRDPIAMWKHVHGRAHQ